MFKKIYVIVSLTLIYSISFSKEKEVTYYKDVFPILQNKCNTCHHSNGFSTLVFNSYDVVKNYAKTIQHVIHNNIMPPWKADSTFSRFKNERYLTLDEKSKINDWIKTGYKIGKPDKNISTTDYAYYGKSRINRKPDAILSFPKSYEIKDELKDKFLYVKIPFEFDEEKILNAIEFIPDNIKYLHHVNFDILEMDPDIDLYKGNNFYEYDRNNILSQNKTKIYKDMNILNRDGSIPKSVYYGSWVPGMSGMDFTHLTFGVKLPKKGVLLMKSIHYSPSSEKAKDSSSVLLYFKENVSKESFRPISHIPIGQEAIEIKPPLFIKPNQKDWFYVKHVIQQDYTLLYLCPHMHLLGKQFESYAVKDNDTIPLIKIKNWDFDWQEFYCLKKPLILKAGTVIYTKGYYDNTSDNPRNPFHPPRFISGDDGMQTSGEMLLLVLFGVDYKKGDENIEISK